MDLGLAGRKVVVSGGTKGVGRTIVEVLAAEGAQIALCARSAAEVDATVAAIDGVVFGAAGLCCMDRHRGDCSASISWCRTTRL